MEIELFCHWALSECGKGIMFDCAWNYHLNWKLFVHCRRVSRKSASIPPWHKYWQRDTYTHITYRKARPQTLKLISLKWCDSMGFYPILQPDSMVYVSFVSASSSSCAQIVIYPCRWFDWLMHTRLKCICICMKWRWKRQHTRLWETHHTEHLYRQIHT